MAARQNHYAESLGESTTTSATDQDKVSLGLTPDPGATYYLVASWAQQIRSTTNDVRAKLAGGPSAVTFQSNSQEAKESGTPIDYLAAGGLGIYVVGAEETEQTFKIQYSAEGGQTAAIKDASLIAIKKDTADQHAEVTARSTTTSGTFIDKTTLTFTPGSQGDYVLLVAADLDAAAGGIFADVQLTVDGTPYGLTRVNQQDTSNVYTWCFSKKVNLTAASHTLKIQIKASIGSGTAVAIANARIIALRADTFDAVQYDEFTTRETQSSTSYADSSASLTFTPAAVSHLIIGSAIHDGSSTSQSAYVQLVEGAAVLAEQIREPVATTDKYAFWCVRRETLAAASTTWKIQSHVESSGTTGLTDGSVTVLRLASAATGVTVTPSALTLAASQPAPAVRRGVTLAPSALSLAASQPAPTSRVHKSVSVAAQGLAAAGQIPAVSGKATVMPAAITVAAAGQAPAVRSAAVVTPAAAGLVSSAVSPAVRVHKTVSVSTLAVASSLPAPTVSGQAVVTPAAQALAAGLATPQARLRGVRPPGHPAHARPPVLPVAARRLRGEGEDRDRRHRRAGADRLAESVK